MEREKQIEEMAVVLSVDECKDCKNCDYNNRFNCPHLYHAELLYKAGYRKQSEGEWVIKDGFLVCSNCDSTKPFAVIRDEIHYFGCNYCNNCGAKMKGDNK